MPLLSLSVIQLLLAFVSASILHKLTYTRFFLKWLASHKFVCYLIPSSNDLKNLKDRGNSSGGTGGRKINKKLRSRTKKDYPPSNPNEVFKVPAADLEYLKLDKSIISVAHLELINYSLDLEWIVDLALMSSFSFTLTQVQFYFYPNSGECNFSILWALLVIMYCVRTLWKLTATYFTNEESIGERSICIMSGCFFLLIAMIILIGDEKRLELGLESAYRSFNESATAFVKNHTLSSEVSSRPVSRPISFILVKFIIALSSALLAVEFTFPGLRYGQLHKALLESSETSNLSRILYNCNYLAPLFIVCLWIRPISRNLMTSGDSALIDDATFDTLRLYCIIVLNLIRFYSLPQYIAIFLSSAQNRVNRLKYRGGTTTNREIQLTVSSIYNYVNVVCLQYALPILMCLFTSIMFKTMGGYDWFPAGFSRLFEGVERLDNSTSPARSQMGTSNSTIFIESYVESPANNYTNSTQLTALKNLVNLNEIKQIFSDEVFRGIFGFATWWLHFSWFCTSTMGVIYHTYFIH